MNSSTSCARRNAATRSMTWPSRRAPRSRPAASPPGSAARACRRTRRPRASRARSGSIRRSSPTAPPCAGIRTVALPPNVRQHLQLSSPHSNGYLLLGEADGTAAIVDPAGDPLTLLEAIAAEGLDLRYILITHEHADHCESAGAVHAAHPAATIVVSAADARGIGTLAARARIVADGESLPFGDGAIHALATPGHTDGSVCFLAGDVVFTGDTLFAGQRGRRVRRPRDLRRHPLVDRYETARARWRRERHAGSRSAVDDRPRARAQPLLLRPLRPRDPHHLAKSRHGRGSRPRACKTLP